MSRYDKKQGLDGIATLTNNPLALINTRKQKLVYDILSTHGAKDVERNCIYPNHQKICLNHGV